MNNNQEQWANYFSTNSANRIGARHVHSDFVEESIDYYQVLGLDPSSIPSVIDVTNAFRKRCAEVHPDKGGSIQEYDLLIKAYKTLSDPKKRLEYDSRTSEMHHEKRTQRRVIKPKKKRRSKKIRTQENRLPKRFHKNFIKEKAKMKDTYDENFEGTLLFDHQEMNQRSISDVHRERAKTQSVQNIMYGGQYDPNVFHRFFDENAGSIKDRPSQSFSGALINPITSNGDIYQIQRGSKGAGGFSFMDCVCVGDDYNNIGVFVADRPMPADKVSRYHQLGDITQKHKELTKEAISAQQERINRYRNDTTRYQQVGRDHHFETGLQF